MSTDFKRSHLLCWLRVAFSGHRHLANPQQITGAIHQTLNELALIHPRLVGVSSAASGSDTLFAEVMLDRKYPFSLILPFHCDQFRKDFPDPEDWLRVQTLIDHAIDVEVLYQMTKDASKASDCSEDGGSAERSAAQKAADATAYMDAGYRTIDRADVLVAVWDGNPGKGFGGTADAVAYARSIGQPLIIIRPDGGKGVDERLDQLRESFGNQFDASKPEPITDPRGEVKAYFNHVNSEAKRHGPTSRFLVRICLQLFLVASAVGSAELIFRLKGAISWALTVLSILTLIIATTLMRRFGKSHRRWLQFRVDAEVCRSFLATWDIRRHATLSHQPRPAIPGLRPLFSNLRLLRQMDRSPKIDMDEALSTYNRDRVQDQIDYFDGALRKAKISLARRGLIMKICSRGAIISFIAVLFLKFFHRGPEAVQQSVHLLSLILPLMATAMGLTLITEEAVRRAARYEEMLSELRQLQTRLLASRTWDAVARVVTDIEEELLQELVEWRSFIRFTRDVVHPG